MKLLTLNFFFGLFPALLIAGSDNYITPLDSVIYADFNCNGIYDDGDTTVPMNGILNQDGEWIGMGNIYGEYEVELPASSINVIEALALPGYLSSPIEIITGDDMVIYSDTNLAMCPTFSLNNIHGTLTPANNPVSGNEMRFVLCITNYGTQSDEIVAEFHLPLSQYVNLISIEDATPISDFYIWEVNLNPFETVCYDIVFEIENGSQSTLFSCSADFRFADNNIEDIDLSDNNLLYQSYISEEHVSNMKEVDAHEVNFLTVEVFETVDLNYFIQFQNTTSDTVTTIVVTDTLSELLDPSTLFITGISHDYVMSIDDHILTWTFENIKLPDSASGGLNSYGMIRYFIRSIENPLITDTIFNSAAIDFDGISILTNEVETYFYNCPDFVDIIGSTAICELTPATYLPAISDFDSYTWLLDGTVISGNDTLFYGGGNSGSHELALIIQNEGCTVTGLIPLEIETFPSASAFADNSVCNEAILQSISNGDVTWFLDETLISEDDTTTVLGSGTYTAVAINSCGSSAASLSVEILDGPDDVSIVESGGTLTVDQVASNYEWYLDNVLIAGADENQYTPIETGAYSAVLEFESGCIMHTDEVNITVGLSENLPIDLSVYPNPIAGESFRIDSHLTIQQYVIYNVFGSLVKTGFGNGKTADVHVSDLPAGVYLLNVKFDGSDASLKLTIE